MDRKKQSLHFSVLSGAVSGCITAVAFQPLEYIKTKLQQPEFKQQTSLSSGNRSIKLVIRLALLNENNQSSLLNARKLWTGLTPALIRSVPVAAFYFGSVDYLKNSPLLSHSKSGGPYQVLHSFLIGVLSRTIADISTHPLNLVKTRYESENYKYKSLSNAFKSIWLNEGFRGLFKGLVPTLLRDISYSGIYYPVYTKIKHLVKENFEIAHKQETMYYAVCAFLSGILACAITQPPDVIRTHVQLNSKVEKKFYQIAQNIYAKNGFRGFFAGFLPRSTRRILISVLSWTLYEKLSLKI